jgi:hypothetical protein
MADPMRREDEEELMTFLAQQLAFNDDQDEESTFLSWHQ